MFYLKNYNDFFYFKDLTGLTLSGRPFGTQFLPNPNNGQISPKIESNSSNNNNNQSSSHNQQDPHIKLESNSSSSLIENNNKNKHNNSSNLVNNNTNNNNNAQQNANTNNSGLNQLPFGNLYIQNPSHNNLQSNQFYPPPHPQQQQQQPLPPHQLHHPHHQQQLPPQQPPPSNGLPPQQSNNIILYSLNNLPPQQQQQQTITPQTDFQLGSLNHLNSQSQQQIRRLTQDWHGTYPNPMATNLMNPMQPQSVEPWIQDEYPEIDIHTPMPEYWCTINYFEGDLQVGDIFKVRSNYLSVVIDGFFDSSREDRFCLGALTNVQRTNASEKARLHIGKGIQLENQMDGSVYVRCLSDYSVFFESYYLDRESGREAFDAVHKIYPGSRVKVFSLRECLRCLKLAATMQLQANQNNNNANNNTNNTNPANSSVNVQNNGPNANNSSNNNNNNVNVDDLRRLCRLRFSFVKGWGPDYPRKSILETPCWCEIQLNRPLQYLDQLINSLSVNSLNTNSGMC